MFHIIVSDEIQEVVCWVLLSGTGITEYKLFRAPSFKNLVRK